MVVNEDMQVEQDISVNIVDGLVISNEHFLVQRTSESTSDNSLGIVKPHVHPTLPFYAYIIDNCELLKLYCGYIGDPSPIQPAK